MTLNRRQFIGGAVACGGGLCAAGCTAVNPAPTVDAAADGSFDLPAELAKPGGQVKARIPGADDLVLVWKTEDGYGAAEITCTHLGSEVHLNASAKTLDCPSHGSRFGLDGKVVHGPAKQALKAYQVAVYGARVRLQPA
ncbi:MAG TPA: Rieske 2Fe-2S domain-containing protein [Planctomycetota bacterium]|nr:Rieske 2Fe-2S domain-containing protein [Planctomycetota bacterium]